MNIIYNSKINYLKEANDLLLRSRMQHEKFNGVLMSDIESIAKIIFSHHHQEEMYKEFNESLVMPISKLTQIGLQAAQSISKELDQFYFEPCFSRFYSVGSLISYYIFIEDSLKEHSLPKDQKQRLLQLRVLGSVTITDVIDYNDFEQDFFSAVDQSFETDKEKWLFIKIMQNIQFYKEEFTTLISPVVLALEKQHFVFEGLAAQCIERIKKGIKQCGVQPFFERWNLKIHKNSSVTFTPLVFRYGELSYSTTSDRPSIQFGVACDYLRLAYETLSQEQLFNGLKALADRRRFEIMKLLAKESYYGQELAEKLSLTPATISHHMEVLINCGFVQLQHDGTKIIYSISKDYILKTVKALQEEFYIE